MLVPVQTFFDTLPGKSCGTCGQALEEQADCYQNTCHPCEDTEFYVISVGNEEK